MLKILKANEEYENNLKHYTKKDGILSLLLFGIIIIMYSVLAVLQIKFNFINENIRLFGCIFNFLVICITILFVKLNNQTLDTIGLFKGKWKNSIIIGIILAIILFYNNGLSYLINGSNCISLKEIPILLVYFLLVAICEEFVFRGYIGTRIYGLFKNKYITICITGVLFIIMHFPYRMIAYGMTLSDLTIGNLSWIIDLFTTHLVFNYIYLKTNSLYGAIIPHWMSNFAYNIILR